MGVWLMLALLVTALAVWAFATVALRSKGHDARARAWTWAEQRGVTLTERSVPYVDTYLRNARALRIVCCAGSVVLAVAFAYGTGILPGSFVYVWALVGYTVGCLWAELSLARVPASSTTREASLVVRDPRRYRVEWVAVGQIALPVALAGLALAALAFGARADGPGASGENLRTAGSVRSETLIAAGLGLVSLAVTALAQRHIVRRPQPRTEADLVAADEAMRTSAVHMIGVNHLVLCLVLAIPGFLHLGHTLPYIGEAAISAAVVLILGAALCLWGLRIQPPARGGGPVPPPPFPAEAAAAIDLSAPGGQAWSAPRRPDLTALAVIAVLAVGLWGLRWLGPTNPDIDAYVSAADSNVKTTGNPPAVQAFVVMVTNRSRLPVQLSDVIIGDLYGPNDKTAPPAITDITVAGTGNGWGRSRGAAYLTRLEGGDTVALTVTVAAPPCPPNVDTPFAVGAYPSSIRLISAVGRHITVGTRPLVTPSMSCVVTLPTGPQPEDPVAARAGVERAFARTYGDDPSRSPDDPVLIDRPDGLDAVTERARQGPSARYIGTTTAVVTQVSFDRPDHAWVLYELRYQGNTINRRRGQAVLVDGTWKLTRETVCADLALAQASCP